MKIKHLIIPIFVPHKGCPYECIFCNQRAISGQYEDMTKEEIRETIEQYISTAGEYENIEVAFFGGSFTGIDKEQQITLLKIANEYVEKGIVNGIRLSTRPDYISAEILEYLKYYNVRTIELGAQSLDESVLSNTRRGHGADIIASSARLIKKMGFNLGIQTMIGLPGDTYEKALSTAKQVIALAPEFVRIYPTLVVKGTYLEKMYLKGLYCPLCLNDAVDLCAELMSLYEGARIKVIRVGLQPTKNISFNGEVVAGPFHPAFRQLAESKLILNDIKDQIDKNYSENCKNILIVTEKGNVSNVIGQKRGNIHYLKEKYNFSNIDVIAAGFQKVKVICR